MYTPGDQDLCVICGGPLPEYRIDFIICSWECYMKYEKMVEVLEKEFLEKVEDLEKRGKAFREEQ